MSRIRETATASAQMQCETLRGAVSFELIARNDNKDDENKM